MRDRLRLGAKVGLSLRFVLSTAFLLLLTFTARDEHSATAAPGYSLGNENSWIRIQNIGDADATVDLSYFDEGGRIAGRDACPSPSCPPLFPGSVGTTFAGPGIDDTVFAATPAGTYFFRCDVHPTTMTGTFIVQ